MLVYCNRMWTRIITTGKNVTLTFKGDNAKSRQKVSLTKYGLLGSCLNMYIHKTKQNKQNVTITFKVRGKCHNTNAPKTKYHCGGILSYC